MEIIKREDKEDSKVYLEIAVPKEDFIKTIHNIYKKSIKNINIPGFRKGKAPQRIVEKMYGNNFFWEKAINEIYPIACSDAIEKEKLRVVDVESPKIISADIDDGIKFSVTCVLLPDVKISQYKELSVNKKIRIATQEDVDKEIKRIQHSYSRKIEVSDKDRQAKIDDEVIIDFEGKINNKVFEGGTASEYALVLGSDQFIPGFEDQIVGHRIGETFDVNVKFPDFYHAEEFAGKDAIFTVTLHEINEIELPELDDEFVKDISEFDNVNDFKENILKVIQQRKDAQSEKEVEDELMDKLLSCVEVNIPEKMIERRVDDLKRSFEMNLVNQGITLDGYLQYIGKDMNEFRDGFKERAASEVKGLLALGKIAEIESIEVSEDEREEKIKLMIQENHMLKDKFREIKNKEGIIENIKINKVIDFIKKTANITEISEV